MSNDIFTALAQSHKKFLAINLDTYESVWFSKIVVN